MAGGLLCLDLASRTGHAYADPDVLDAWPRIRIGQRHPLADRVLHGAEQFATGNAGKTGHEYETWLRTMIVMLEPYAIIYEAPLPAAMRGPEAAQIAWGLAWETEKTAYRARMQARTVHVSTVKASFTGSGHSKKPKMMAVARQMGFDPTDNNAADALAVMHHAAVEFWPALRRHAA